MKAVASLVAIVFVVAIVLLMRPLDFIADTVWPTSVAPWEQVNAYYYPNIQKPSGAISKLNVGSLEQCRDWVGATATSMGNPNMEGSDYACMSGCKDIEGSTTCRLTIK